MAARKRSAARSTSPRASRQAARRVDHFIHYFKDLAGYSRYFGITPERSIYVPFKVNSWHQLPPRETLSADGAYVFTGGRSLRDLDTFVEAMRRVSCPGQLLYHDPKRMRADGTTLCLDGLPAHVRAVEDDGSVSSWLAQLAGAKVVVLTPAANSIRAIGVSTCLVAMALKKCVIITDSPTTRCILRDEVVIVPPEDPVALAAAIDRAWNDDVFREGVAARGRAYAERAQGAERLLTDLLRVCRARSSVHPLTRGAVHEQGPGNVGDEPVVTEAAAKRFHAAVVEDGAGIEDGQAGRAAAQAIDPAGVR